MNDAAFTQPARQTVTALVDAYHVEWLFVSRAYPVDLKRLSALSGVVTKVYFNRHYAVFKVVTQPST